MRILPGLLSAALAAAPLGAVAQSAPPTTAPSPAPAPSATPSVLGPSLGDNDPCTSLAAIVTRPTVANSVCTVKPGHIEIEGGYQNVSSPGANTVLFPQGTIRLGLQIPRLELQVTPPGGERTSTGGAVVTGLTDAGAGLKYLLGFTPKTNYSLQINATIPSGSAVFSAGSAQVFAALQAGYTISPAFSLTAMMQEQWLSNGQQRWNSFVPALVLSATLGSTTLFAEAAQFSHAVGPGSATRTQLLAGVSEEIGSRLQIDVEAATSPTAATGRYHSIGFGFGYYF